MQKNSYSYYYYYYSPSLDASGLTMKPSIVIALVFFLGTINLSPYVAYHCAV
jgi:hypothetical protein